MTLPQHMQDPAYTLVLPADQVVLRAEVAKEVTPAFREVVRSVGGISLGRPDPSSGRASERGWIALMADLNRREA